MASFNKVILMGNLTRDPETRTMPSGAAVSRLAIAVNRKFKQGETMTEEVSYVDIDAFGRQAELCQQYLKKGAGVLVEGRLKQDRFQAKDGTKRSVLKVVAQNIQFMPRKGAAPDDEIPVDDIGQVPVAPDAESQEAGEI